MRDKKQMVQLMGTLRSYDDYFLKKNYIVFMRILKKLSKKSVIYFLFHKRFIKIFLKLMFSSIH